MSQLEWIKQVRPDGTLRWYILKGGKITAKLKKLYSEDSVWVLYCGPLNVDKTFFGEPERSIDELLQTAKAYLLATAEKKLCDLQAFVDQISDSESPQ